MRDDLTVVEAAEALGTSPQTVRALLRKGELTGQKRAWGERYVWVVSRAGVQEFLAEHGRLDGHRRTPRTSAAPPPPAFPTAPPGAFPDGKPAHRRPFALRPRGRATVVVVVLGVPGVVAYTAARILPGAWWFGELGQGDVFSRVIAAQVQLTVMVTLVSSGVVGVNLAAALCRTGALRRSTGVLGIVAVAVVTGSMFGSAAAGHWQAYLLWRHRQPFDRVDPIHGRDVGFFVFTLPVELLVTNALFWLVVVSVGYVVVVNRARGTLGFRPFRATFGAQVHLACLAAALLLVVAWRLHLERYTLEIDQPSGRNGDTFSGAGYVDVHVRLPGLDVLIVLVVVLAAACVLAPLAARAGRARSARLAIQVSGAALVLAFVLVGGVIPALVQRYAVDPSPLLSEERYLSRSITATRAGLGLDAIDVQRYAPAETFTAADYRSVSARFPDVSVWDSWVLGDRMRELVTDTPYFSPQHPVLDVDRVEGRRQPTVVSTRDLDLREAPDRADAWINDRLAYTHGLGVVRYATTGTTQGRGPHLIDRGLGVRQPRLYFGNFPHLGVDGRPEGAQRRDALTTGARGLDPDWALADTRRPEVDLPTSEDQPSRAYHYTGTGGIELSSWIRRAVFAFGLGSKQLLLSDDVTPESRLLLHRDVRDRLQTLAPFIQWDATAVPITHDGRVVFVVDGYTTSTSYPYAERVDLGGSRVNYARASVHATVDSFSGQVELYLADDQDPIAAAWADAFPSLFRDDDEMPAGLRSRLRYPADLFDAQSTAYERFHTTSPAVFASDADAWSRPLALSGPLEVAGGVDFDEDDEDDLRTNLGPSYTFSAPPGQAKPRLTLATQFTPSKGQNLVATLVGWIDSDGRARLNARALPRDQTFLGPAQVSRLVFSTPRVRNLLGLRNLETTDLSKSSLDAVLLGRPQLLFTPAGIIQVQSLYEGSRGPGAARLLGVTAFLNGRAGLGPDLESAVRQALNDPPKIHILRPRDRLVVGEPGELRFALDNARRETVTVTSKAGVERWSRRVTTGRATVPWTPSAAGAAHVRIEVRGLDGTTLTRSRTFHVRNPPPTLRVVHAPRHAEVGRTVRVSFKVANALRTTARVSTRSGVAFARDYLIRDGPGVLQWTPEAPGPVVIVIRARGHQGQTSTERLRLDVARAPKIVPPPVLAVLHVPAAPTVGEESTFAFEADGCSVAVARIEGPEDDARIWRFPCSGTRSRFAWTPTSPGPYLFTVTARGVDGQTTNQTVRLTVAAPETATPRP